MNYMEMCVGVATEDDCALTILCTVVSRPARDRVIVDAGSKCLSSDFHRLTDRMSGYDYLRGSGGTLVARLSEEHGVIALNDRQPDLAIGDRVEIIPNHACAAVNLFDTLHGVRNGDVEVAWPILARGKVR